MLAKALARVGKVMVVAPSGEQSASSHSLTLHRPLRIYKHSPSQFSVDGTPTDCINLAVHTILGKKPDLVVSGINAGANLGDDVHYSGTVSAAVEGALIGIPAIAISLVVSGDRTPYFETAAQFAAKLGRGLLGRKESRPFVLNVNVPNLSPREVRGYRFTTLGKRNYGEIIFEKKDPRGRKYYWIGGDDRSFEDLPGSDGNAVQEKRISITPLQVDLTHYALLEEIRHWKV